MLCVILSAVIFATTPIDCHRGCAPVDMDCVISTRFPTKIKIKRPFTTNKDPLRGWT